MIAHLRGQSEDISVPLTDPTTEAAISWMSLWILSIALFASISRQSTPVACANHSSARSNRVIVIILVVIIIISIIYHVLLIITINKRGEWLLFSRYQEVQALAPHGYHACLVKEREQAI